MNVNVFTEVALGRGVEVGFLVGVPGKVELFVGKLPTIITDEVAVFGIAVKVGNGLFVTVAGSKVGERITLAFGVPALPTTRAPAMAMITRPPVLVSVAGTADPESMEGSSLAGTSVAAGDSVGMAVDMPGSVPTKRYLNGVDVSASGTLD